MKNLEGCIEEFDGTNRVITNSDNVTVEDCNSSFKYMDTVCESMRSMDKIAISIAEKMDQMLKESENTTQRMQQYTGIMQKTNIDMENIQHSAKQTGRSIDSFEKGIKEIAGFVATISNIIQRVEKVSKNLLEISGL